MADTVAEQIAALKDDDWAIREEAATALGTLRDARAVVPLVSVLRDEDRAVREAAKGALTAIGEPSVPVLGLCLSDPQLEVQEAASSILASIADDRVLAPLIASLGNRDWIVRMHAASLGVDVVHAAVTGKSTLIGAGGEVTETTELFTEDILVGTVRFQERRKTLYAVVGDWVQLLAIGAALVQAIGSGRPQRDFKIRPQRRR